MFCKERPSLVKIENDSDVNELERYLRREERVRPLAVICKDFGAAKCLEAAVLVDEFAMDVAWLTDQVLVPHLDARLGRNYRVGRGALYLISAFGSVADSVPEMRAVFRKGGISEDKYWSFLRGASRKYMNDYRYDLAHREDKKPVRRPRRLLPRRSRRLNVPGKTFRSTRLATRSSMFSTPPMPSMTSWQFYRTRTEISPSLW